jgi:RNA polymerase-binding transcription factor DksA
MQKIDLEHLERRLLEERDRTLRMLQRAEEDEAEGQSESAGELSRAPDHPADRGSDTQEAEKDWANVTRASDQLARIDRALELLREDPEGYATCERCGRGIEPERLDLIPWTRLCANCARGAEGG